MYHIVLVEYNRPDVLEKCLASWGKHDDVKLYYVDSGSPEKPDFGMLSKYASNIHYMPNNAGPAICRNYYWKQLLETADDNDILVKADGDCDILDLTWKSKMDEFFKNGIIDSITVGSRNMLIEHSDQLSRYPYQLIFVRAKEARKIGLFKSYCEETGIPWGGDDIDYIYRLTMVTKVFMFQNTLFYKHHDRPAHLCDNGWKKDGKTFGIFGKLLHKWFDYYDETKDICLK